MVTLELGDNGIIGIFWAKMKLEESILGREKTSGGYKGQASPGK